MSKLPPIPKEQRSFKGPRTDDGSDDTLDHADRDIHVASQGRHGNAKQNLVAQRMSGDR